MCTASFTKGAPRYEPAKSRLCPNTDKRTLDDVIDGADLFLGLSGPNVLKPEMVKRMAKRPIIFALATKSRNHARYRPRGCTRCHYRNGAQRFSKSGEQRFMLPFIFRGALDVGATEINDAMQIACIDGIAELARATTSAEAAAAYQGKP